VKAFVFHCLIAIRVCFQNSYPNPP
jgi:hypothetical protein